MYDFEGDHGSAAGGGPAPWLLALEAPRFGLEYGASRALDAAHCLLRTDRTRGQGRPVLVLPGFSANDRLTGRLRAHLTQRGWDVHGWGLGTNHGLTEQIVDGLPRRFAEIAERTDGPVSIVGWSFGGLLARWLAHEHPEHVRQVICLGSPWRAEGEQTRATAMFERSREKHGMVEEARAIVDRLRGPVPVPLTAIWSKSDGIVPWRGCAVDAASMPPAENVEVVSSHVGMVANPLVLRVVVDRLSQDVDAWQPYGRAAVEEVA